MSANYETAPGREKTVFTEDTVRDKAGLYANAEDKVLFRKGSLLLDTYRIDTDPIQGGMGSVWKVHHLGWGMDIAMKRPQTQKFLTQQQKDSFFSECESWMNLGLHPNIVTCYYIREIESVPTIFAEWMDGGSLGDLIRDGVLYRKNSKGKTPDFIEEHRNRHSQLRLLDIAIQFARGLLYAHNCGIIHQDVKPDNVLLNESGEVKVADFGIAKARAAITLYSGEKTQVENETVLSPAGGFTPAYCSMEQMNGEILTRRTDIYSWAVSVMEMYLGNRPWQNGVVAGLCCEEYLHTAAVPVPAGLRELLIHCMADKPGNRPHDFAEICEQLESIYSEVSGNTYPSPPVPHIKDTPDSLNNRALGFWDIGMKPAAVKVWEQAVDKDASSENGLFNLALALWRTGEKSYEEAKSMLLPITNGMIRRELDYQLSEEAHGNFIPYYEKTPLDYDIDPKEYSSGGRYLSGRKSQKSTSLQSIENCVIDTYTGQTILSESHTPSLSRYEHSEYYHLSREGQFAWLFLHDSEGKCSVDVYEMPTGRLVYHQNESFEILVSDNGILLAERSKGIDCIDIFSGEKLAYLPGFSTDYAGAILPGDWALLRERDEEDYCYRSVLVQLPNRESSVFRKIILPIREIDSVYAVAYSEKLSLLASDMCLVLVRSNDDQAAVLRTFNRVTKEGWHYRTYENIAFLNNGCYVMDCMCEDFCIWDAETGQLYFQLPKESVSALQGNNDNLNAQFCLWRAQGAGQYVPGKRAEFRLSVAESAGSLVQAGKQAAYYLRIAEAEYQNNRPQNALHALDLAQKLPGYDISAEILNKRFEYAKNLKKLGIRRIVMTEELAENNRPGVVQTNPVLDRLVRSRVKSFSREVLENFSNADNRSQRNDFTYQISIPGSGYLSQNGKTALYHFSLSREFTEDDLCFSEDDLRYMKRYQGIMVFDKKGRKLFQKSPISDAVLSPDGRYLAYIEENRLQLVSLADRRDSFLLKEKVLEMDFTPNSDFLMVMTENEEVCIFHVESQSLWAKKALPKTVLPTMEFDGEVMELYDHRAFFVLDDNSFACELNEENRIWLIEWDYGELQ